MNSIRSFIRTTVLGGLFFLFPIIVTIILLTKAGEIVKKLTQPISNLMPVDAIAGVGIELIITVTTLMLICFLAGLIARTPFGKNLISNLEQDILYNFPGYEFLKGLGENMAQIDNEDGTIPVLVAFDEGSQFAFLVEPLPNGKAVIFIPDAPNPMGGAVMVVEEERLTTLPAGSRDMLKVLKSLGYGSQDLMDANLQAGAAT